MFIGPTLKNLHIRLELENLASKLSGQKYNFWQFDARNLIVLMRPPLTYIQGMSYLVLRPPLIWLSVAVV